ncbi:MAG TPA: hydrogenase maturation nickel metallochaperone HypA [Symbiobacteriaceae bacterium]|nr:hydrogenase maturation nickel metallochaperone HypA [Symbiobacteriaceae bacterium]
MHELSLAQSLMDVVSESAAQEGIRRIHRVTAVVGAWSAIIPEVLTNCYDMLAAEAGDLFAGSQLIIVTKPAMGECKSCGEQFPAEVTGLICPACGSGARLITGTELAVDSYEGD